MPADIEVNVNVACNKLEEVNGVQVLVNYSKIHYDRYMLGFYIYMVDIQEKDLRYRKINCQIKDRYMDL